MTDIEKKYKRAIIKLYENDSIIICDECFEYRDGIILPPIVLTSKINFEYMPESIENDINDLVEALNTITELNTPISIIKRKLVDHNDDMYNSACEKALDCINSTMTGLILYIISKYGCDLYFTKLLVPPSTLAKLLARGVNWDARISKRSRQFDRILRKMTKEEH